MNIVTSPVWMQPSDSVCELIQKAAEISNDEERYKIGTDDLLRAMLVTDCEAREILSKAGYVDKVAQQILREQAELASGS